jgi:hypothetical protein
MAERTSGRPSGVPVGQIPAALGQAGLELLAKDPDIRLVDVLAVKSLA